MSPVGGASARRLRGATGLLMLAVSCSCGQQYEVARAHCPNKACLRPTRDIPTAK